MQLFTSGWKCIIVTFATENSRLIVRKIQEISMWVSVAFVCRSQKLSNEDGNKKNDEQNTFCTIITAVQKPRYYAMYLTDCK